MSDENIDSERVGVRPKLADPAKWLILTAVSAAAYMFLGEIAAILGWPAEVEGTIQVLILGLFPLLVLWGTIIIYDRLKMYFDLHFV